MNQYFVFFWGNPGSDTIRLLKTTVPSLLSGMGFERARNNEKEFVRNETYRIMEKKADKLSWKDAYDYNQDMAETRKAIINSETIILNAEEKIKKGFAKVTSDFFS